MLFDIQRPREFFSRPIYKQFDKIPLKERLIVTDRQIQLTVPRPGGRLEQAVDNFNAQPPVLDVDYCRLPITPAQEVIVVMDCHVEKTVKIRSKKADQMLSSLGVILFFDMHFAMHKFHSLHLVYKYVHAMHHDGVHLMNAYEIGYADFGDNLLIIGVPWAIWTLIAGSNWWNWMLPFSLMLRATYIGHSGYRSASPWFTLFNPLFLPIMLIVGKQALSPAAHQVHHTYRRYNFGLFLRLLDKWHKTYKKSEKMAYDVHYWKKWVRVKENRESLVNNKWEAGIKFEELAI